MELASQHKQKDQTMDAQHKQNEKVKQIHVPKEQREHARMSQHTPSHSKSPTSSIEPQTKSSNTFGKAKSFLKKTAFVQSFVYEKKHGYVMLFDYVYYLLMIFLGSFYMYRVLPRLYEVQMQAPQIQQLSLTTVNPELMAQISQLESTFFAFKLYTILVTLGLVLSYCFFKYLVWSFILNRKLTPKQFGKFILLNAITTALVLLIATLLYTFIKDEIIPVFMFMTFLWWIYLIVASHPLFVASESLKTALRETHRFRTVRTLVLPLTAMTIMGLLIFNLLPLLLFLPDIIHLFVILFIIVMYTTWAKNYIFIALEQKQMLDPKT